MLRWELSCVCAAAFVSRCSEFAMQGRQRNVQLLGLLLVPDARAHSTPWYTRGLLVCGVAWVQLLLLFQPVQVADMLL